MDYPELEPVLERILEVVPAQQIILFGSRAKGQSRPDSDYDLLVVVPPHLDKREAMRVLYLGLSQIQKGFPVDVLVAYPEDLQNYREAWMTIYPEALEHGQVLYAA
ncbi:MAG: nucleotidyltransferase domain-containing protein [Meiothermus sp.]